MVEIYSKYLKALDELCDDISLGVPELLSHFRTTDPGEAIARVMGICSVVVDRMQEATDDSSEYHLWMCRKLKTEFDIDLEGWLTDGTVEESFNDAIKQYAAAFDELWQNVPEGIRTMYEFSTTFGGARSDNQPFEFVRTTMDNLKKMQEQVHELAKEAEQGSDGSADKGTPGKNGGPIRPMKLE